jgi:aminopeptidase N
MSITLLQSTIAFIDGHRSMRTDTPVTTFRTDYTPPNFFVDSVQLGFDLNLKKTLVACQFTVRRNQAATSHDLVLHGRDCPLVWIAINGSHLTPAQFSVDGETLTVPNVPHTATVQVVTRLNPAKNSTMMGLYASRGNLFTQCEAQGMRRITWFPDRPDVMARYTVMLRADRKDFPVLLSNGNLIESGRLPDGRHYAKWEDPFPKPAYLFALVAGKLACLQDSIESASGHFKLLQIYVEKQDLKKAAWAMECLKHSIRWDERRFGLELDLERFMIVAVSDYNMGAMENKGLNIFNTGAVLAHKNTQTDDDFLRVESVVGHEYFHNWTGNRVTCRDWFQLTLKEGLTVFRDQEFSADMAAAAVLDAGLGDAAAASARAVLRIGNVRDLRSVQYPEDAGPMAHPIRPESFQDISNFYTATVYEKGSEVIRMQHTLLGETNFRKGMDLYFARHDGQAVTCDDFMASMQDASGVDLQQFARWYSQAGTPGVAVSGVYDAAAKTYTLTLTQSCPKVGVETLPGAPEKLPFHIPFAIGLLDAQGQDIALRLTDSSAPAANTLVLDFKQAQQTFTFVDIPAEPIPSLLRGYSAPVNLKWDASDAQLAFLLAHDSDAFNRCEAGQTLALRHLVALTQTALAGNALFLDDTLVDAYAAVLRDPALDAAFKVQALTLPDESVIAEQLPVLVPAAIRRARVFVRQTLGTALQDDWAACHAAQATPGEYSPDPVSAGKRSLKNLALAYWLESGDLAAIKAAKRQYKDANNMTDRFGALSALVNIAPEAADKQLADFYKRYRDDALVVDKWFRLQSGARHASAESVTKLMSHKAFTMKNPNRMRSVVFGFCLGNPAAFHAADGSGYALWAKTLPKLDRINPDVAARLARALDRWRKLAPEQQALALPAMQAVRDAGLAKPSAEVLGKALEI